jgi:hypothetical protein
MKVETRNGLRRRFVLILPLLACLSLLVPSLAASAQHYRHRHKVVRTVRVRRHGHWVTVRRVYWR